MSDPRSVTFVGRRALTIEQVLGLARGELSTCHERSRVLHAAVRKLAERHTQDRPMDGEIEALLECYRSDGLPIGAIDFA